MLGSGGEGLGRGAWFRRVRGRARRNDACPDDGRIWLHRLVGGPATGRGRGRGLDPRPEGRPAPPRPPASTPRKAWSGSTSSRATSPTPGTVRSRRARRSRGDAPAPPRRACRCRPAGPTRSSGRRSTSWGPSPCSRRRATLKGSGRAGGLRELGGGPRADGAEDFTGPLGDEVRLAPLTHYGAFKVCNELNAKVYWLDRGLTSVGLRPWTVYGVGRDFGVTSEPTKAIKSAAFRPAVCDQLRRPARPPVRRRRRLDLPPGPLRTRSRGPTSFNIRGAVVPIESFVAAFREVSGLDLDHPRRPPVADCPGPGRLAVAGRLRAAPRRPRSPTGWARPSAGSSPSATRAGSTCRTSA